MTTSYIEFTQLIRSNGKPTFPDFVHHYRTLPEVLDEVCQALEEIAGPFPENQTLPPSLARQLAFFHVLDELRKEGDEHALVPWPEGGAGETWGVSSSVWCQGMHTLRPDCKIIFSGEAPTERPPSDGYPVILFRTHVAQILEGVTYDELRRLNRD